MERTKDIEILMKDGSNRSEAEKLLKNGSIIFYDFEKNFDSYMKEWDCDGEEKDVYKNMVDTKKPVADWGVVELDGHTYYIAYSF